MKQTKYICNICGGGHAHDSEKAQEIYGVGWSGSGEMQLFKAKSDVQDRQIHVCRDCINNIKKVDITFVKSL